MTGHPRYKMTFVRTNAVRLANCFAIQHVTGDVRSCRRSEGGERDQRGKNKEKTAVTTCLETGEGSIGDVASF